MRLFICWSGTRGQALANLLKQRLPKLLESLDVDVSLDIAKGARWLAKLEELLGSADAGLVCLTPEGVRSPWVHYEAGALAFGLKAKGSHPLFTYLFGVDSSALRGPLTSFQSTQSTREDTRHLVASLAALIKKMGKDPGTWEQGYDTWWKSLEEKMHRIEKLPFRKLLPDFPQLFSRKTFQEPLARCTSQSWIDRYSGALETLDRIKDERALVASECREYVLELYDQIISELDAYAMDMKALLLRSERFPLSQKGHVDIEPGILTTCEDRRTRCKRLLNLIIDERRAPVVDDACRFRHLESFEEKKTLIHAKEPEIEARIKASRNSGKKKKRLQEELEKASKSEWVFDRIVFYLAEEKLQLLDTEQCLSHVRREFEKVRAATDQPSLMGVSYSLRLLRTSLKDPDDKGKEDVMQLLVRLWGHIKDPALDEGGQVKESLLEIAEMLGEANQLDSAVAVSEEVARPA
jgi:hypothetical protein